MTMSLLRHWLVIFVSIVCTTQDARAGWLGDTLGNLGRAAGDVLSLGQTGRDRDRERAEAERARSEQARAAAEQQRKLQIDALTKDVSLLRDVTKSFESSVDAINGVVSLQAAISNAGSQEIGARAASYAIVEKVRDYFRKDRGDLDLLLRVVNSTQYVRGEDLNRVFGATPDSNGVAALDKIRKSQVAATEAVKSQLAVLKQSGLTEEAFLDEALKKLKTDDIKQIIALAEESKLKLRKLSEELDGERRSYRAQLANQVSALATLSTTDRAGLAEKWEAGLKPPESPAVPQSPKTAAASTAGLGARLPAIQALQQTAVMMRLSRSAEPSPPPQKMRVCLSFGLSCFDADVQ